jgi:hypothetical protein
VEFCGAVIHGTRNSKRRKALELLSLRDKNSFVAYSSGDLEGKLGLSVGGASGLIRDIRKRISKVLQEQLGIVCGEEDVILSGGPGFRLSEKLSVHLADDAGASADQGQGRGKLRIDVPNRVPNVPDPHVPNVPNVSYEGDQLKRRNWILARMRRGNGVVAKDVEREFGCCRKTALRDLQALHDEGLVDRNGPRRNRVYRLREMISQSHNSGP